MEQHVILGLAWIFFCVMHSVLANVTIKKKLSLQLGQNFRFYRLYYTLFAALSFLLVLIYQLNLTSPNVFTRSDWSNAAGLIVGITGLAVMAVCIKKYFAQLSGLKTLFTDEIRWGNSLIITGIHRHVRHPLYFGTFYLFGDYSFFFRLLQYLSLTL